MPPKNDQPHYFGRYLSLTPVFAVVAISLAITTWILINNYFPDILVFPE